MRRVWKMHVDVDRLPEAGVVISFDPRDRPKQKFWVLLQLPESELCVKPPGYDEDLVITTDSPTLTLVHLGRLRPGDAERQGVWQVDASPELVRAMPKMAGTLQPLRWHSTHPNPILIRTGNRSPIDAASHFHFGFRWKYKSRQGLNGVPESPRAARS